MATYSQVVGTGCEGMAMHCHGAGNVWECVASPLATDGHAFEGMGMGCKCLRIGCEGLATCLKTWEPDRKFYKFLKMSL